MTFTRNPRRWVLPIVILAAVASLVGLLPHFGFTGVSKAPLWTEQPAAQSTPALAPDWVRLSKEAKPAVVNISTKRNTDGQAMPDLQGGRPGDRSPEDFFRRFFDEAPRRPVRAVGSCARPVESAAVGRTTPSSRPTPPSTRGIAVVR